MSDKFISSFHIQKLGHSILEIRERALLNIISKLGNGLLFDNDLARSRELLEKLFEWFLFKNPTQVDLVLDLLERILKSDCGQLLIQHYGQKLVIEKLNNIGSFINPNYFAKLDNLLQVVQKKKVTCEEVPPLQSEVPLSYRSDESNELVKFSSATVGTTATAVTGKVEKGSSLEQQVCPQIGSSSRAPNYSDETTYRLPESLTNLKLYVVLKWQPLIEPDKHVLESVEKSLKAPLHPSDLLHSCEFFNNVLLNDFPAEIFIQRPSIVLQFLSLIQTCSSARIVNSVLSCVQKLTKALQIRINHSKDPCMQNLKLEDLPQIVSFCNSPSLDGHSENGDLANIEPFESPEETVGLKTCQLTLPDYCFYLLANVLKCMRTRRESLSQSKLLLSQAGYNIGLILLDEVVNLLSLTFAINIWEMQQMPEKLKVIKDINDVFVEYGDTLEYFRLDSASSHNDINCRVIYLYLLHNLLGILTRFIPFSKTSLVLPVNCRNFLVAALLDVSLSRLYPEVHQLLLKYVQSFSSDGDDSLKKYDVCNKICKGLSATVRFIKEHQSLGFTENINLAKISLPSLEFHKDLSFLDIFVNICSMKTFIFADNKEVLYTAEEIILELLSHHLSEIQLEAYRLCHKKVMETVGPRAKISPTGIPGSQIYFLLSSKIFIEMALFALGNQEEEIHKYAEDILLHILKCKILVSERVWNKVVEVLIPSLPVICCHGGSGSLGRSVVALMDPDTSREICLPDIVMIKSNIEFLFAKESFLREEAFSRITWLMANQQNSREFLPKINTLYDKALANACRLRRLVDVNKIRHTEHFYQPSSLGQVMELLKSSEVEPVIRRSALNQVSVMMEDSLLHDVFLDLNGLKVFMEIMESALTEKNYRDYPDSVIPVISVFKNLCLFHSSTRESLSCEVDVFYLTLRGLYLFFTEERMREDCATLLFLLVFKDFVSGTPSNANFAVPALLCDKITLPFVCSSYWPQSYHKGEDLKAIVSVDRWCLSSIQIQWNSEIFGGFQELVKWDKPNYDEKSVCWTEDILKLSNYDLSSIKLSSLDFKINHYLTMIQSAVSHHVITEAIEKLTLYVELFKSTLKFNSKLDENWLLIHPLENSFSKFLKSLPSCEEDLALLRTVVSFLIIVFPFYKKEEECWISKMLKDHTLCILDVISIDANTSEEAKILGQELLNLIIVCVLHEQHYLNFYMPCSKANSSWSHVIQIISDNLKFGDTQHFYNLAYLDSLLACLVHLTATLSWSETKPDCTPKDPLPQMILGLCELVTAFHCGKGPTAALSVMGLSITRHVVLTLNHLLSELQNSKAKGWESYFFGDFENPNPVKSFFTLWGSRDVVLRAAALQLFSGLAVSVKAACRILNDLKIDSNSVWELALAAVLDHKEAGIVRENAAHLLANLASHIPPLSQNGTLTNGFFKREFSVDILKCLEESTFFNNLEILLSNLFTLKFVEKGSGDYFKNLKSEGSSASTYSDNEDRTISTPGLVKAVCVFLYNLISLTHEEICNKLLDHGLVKFIFRTLCNPSISISNTRELSLYCDLLDMNIHVILLLKKLACTNPHSLGIVLHTRDCLNVMFSLLNPEIYHTHLPQLLYLRNKLWSEIFNLTATLIECSDDNKKVSRRSIDALAVICEIVNELGTEPFLETYCESLSCLGTDDLQNAALLALTSLLRVESQVISEAHPEKTNKSTIQTLLDTVYISKTVAITWKSKDKENEDSKQTCLSSTRTSLKTLSNKYENNLLEEAYFGKVINKTPSKEIAGDIEVSFSENGSDGLKAGAEVCKILLYLYDICDIKLPKYTTFNRKKSMVIGALTGLLFVSKEAKRFALEHQLLDVIVKQLRDYHIKLSLESVEYLRRVQDKKRICPVLAQLNDLIGLLTNFMIDDANIITSATSLNLADITHKLWVWFAFQNVYLINILRMMCVFTTCKMACQTLPFTSSTAGSGPRRTPSNFSLLHAIIALVIKEMDQLSKTHNLSILDFSLNILSNCCDLLECRLLISKSGLLQCTSRLHPFITKRQKSWESVELLWLEFLQIFTEYPEGQATVVKVNEVLDLILSLSLASKPANREAAMLVLRNLSFHQPNRLRLLSSGDFLNILHSKLSIGTNKEKNIVVVIIWALAANNQKAKLILKSAQIDQKLEYAIKQSQLPGEQLSGFQEEEIVRMHYVLNMLRSSDKGYQPGKVSQKYKRQGFKYTLLFFILAHATLSSSYVPPTLGAIKYIVRKENFTTDLFHTLPYYSWMPFHYDTGPRYLLGLAYQAGPMFSYAYSIVGMDSLFMNIMNCIGCNFNIIQGAFTTIRERSVKKIATHPALDSNGLYNSKKLMDIMNQEMKKVCKHLQKVFKVCEDLENIHKYLTLAQATATLFILCTCLYLVSTTPFGSKQFFAEIVYMMAMAFQLVLYCWFGNEVTIKSQEMSVYLWKSDWLASDTNFKKSMIMVTTRTKKPVYMTAGNFAPLTLSTFMAIIKTSYSVFTLIKNTSD